MIISDVPMLLKQISLADPRILRDDPAEQRGQVAMWASVLRDVPPEFALDAVGLHYADSPFTVLPSDIATRWKAEVRRRMAKHTDPTPAVDPNDEIAYRRAIRDGRTAVAQGVTQPQGVRQLMPAIAEEDVRAMRQQGDLKEFIRLGMAQGRTDAAARKALVLRHPEIAARLTKPPFGYKSPEQWAGGVPPETFNGTRNDSPLRPAVLQLLADAQALES